MNKKEKAILDWFNENDDIMQVGAEMAQQHFLDRLLYGYNPYDYITEMKLNFYHQIE